MSDRNTFIDSNIILYLFTDDDKKKGLVREILNLGYTISTQVVNENGNVCLRKLKLSKEEAFAHGKNLFDVFNGVPVGPSTISSAFPLSLKYGFSYWDSLIVAAALTSGCSTLLSEDMQDGLLIEGKLRIKNPF